MATPPRKRPATMPSLPANDEAPAVAVKHKSAKAPKKLAVGTALEATNPAPTNRAPSIPVSRAKPRKAAAKAAPPAGPANMRQAKFAVGSVVRHRVYPFRGVVFDIDPVFNNTEDWWQAIPEEIRPRKDQPFYHLLAENAETTYVAYVSEQNLLADKTGQPVRHPQVKEMFALDDKGHYRARFLQSH
jgi:heat shock protein HspQ